MDLVTPDPNFHVLVVGAGSVGLLIAQNLKKLGIKCTVFERESYLNQRPREWNFGIYWAQVPLTECLPHSIINKLSTAQVDPDRAPREDDFFPIFNAQTGVLLKKLPTGNVFRLNRPRFRALIAEGVDIQYGKRLRTIAHPEVTFDGKNLVTALFEDGTEATGNLLIGADGSRSKVREYLLGPRLAALQPLPLVGCLAIMTTFPPDLAVKIRKDYHDILLNGSHPDGANIFMSLHEIPSPSQPETWKWMLTLTWKYSPTESLHTRSEIRSAWDTWANKLTEPFHSACASVPKDAPIWFERIAHWPTVAWDNRWGTVSLAGDAAHPMTFHRGQGLNNAIHDAAYLCRALDTHVKEGKPLAEAMAVYETEVVERGRKAVEESARNSLMIHEWEKMKESMLFRDGMKKIS